MGLAAGGLLSATVLGLLSGLLLLIGGAIGGRGGLLVALGLAAAMNFFSYWFSDRIVLAMHRAQPVTREQAPQLYAALERLTGPTGTPMPKVYLLPEEAPNAFATGRNPHHAAVAVTAGLMRLLTAEELEGVLAHELAHVKNRDTLTMTITATLAGAIGMLGNFAFFFMGSRGSRDNPLGAVGALVAMLVAPIAAMLVQFAISRSREYEADRTGAEISGDPMSLASALAKIHNTALRVDNPVAEANPATAHLFIMNPLGGRLAGLFSTHPPTEERIRRLRAFVA